MNDNLQKPKQINIISSFDCLPVPSGKPISPIKGHIKSITHENAYGESFIVDTEKNQIILKNVLIEDNLDKEAFNLISNAESKFKTKYNLVPESENLKQHDQVSSKREDDILNLNKDKDAHVAIQSIKYVDNENNIGALSSIHESQENKNISIGMNELTGDLVVKSDNICELINENNYERIKREAVLKHPRNIVNGQPEVLPMCSTSSGWFCCGKKADKSDFTKFSLGLEIYFKALKSLLLTFFLIVLVNIPLYYIYYSNSSNLSIKDYKDALFKTTIGNIGSSKYYLNNYNHSLFCLQSNKHSGILQQLHNQIRF